MSWLIENLDTTRSIREPQMLLLGVRSSGKTFFLEMLKKFLSVISFYVLPERRDDFSNVSNDYDLWVMDDFHAEFMSVRVLNKVLDGH